MTNTNHLDINTLSSMQGKSLKEIRSKFNFSNHQVYNQLNNLILNAKKDKALQAEIIKVLAGNENETPHQLITKTFHTRLNKEYHPSLEELEIYRSIWENEKNYHLPTNAIRKLFAQYPNNTDEAEILLKVSVVNDLYGTTIFSKTTVAEHIKKFQDIDDRLQSGDTTLVNTIQTIQIEKNGLEKDLNLYSFFSKYCHFHNPDNFPIYDSFIDQVLCFFLKKDDFRKDKQRIFKTEALKNYETFCTILSDFKEHYMLNQVSVSNLDKYLWLLGKDMFPRNY